MNYPTADIPYSSVCGRITAYQFGATNAFLNFYGNPQTTTINSPYVDGVRLTHGNPREHIWTFAAALDSQNNNIYTDSKCPCTVTPPPFVGKDYFCDTGSMNIPNYYTFLTDPLLDGTDCLNLL